MPAKPFVVVVGTDFSKQAARGIRAAYEQASRTLPAELHVAHVTLAANTDDGYPTAPSFEGLGGLRVVSLEEQIRELNQHVKDVLSSSCAGERQLRIVAHVILDAPVFGLTRLASELEADLIVVGSHGHHGLARWMLGSVADGVVRQAPCAVLVVPPESEDLLVPAIEPPCGRCLEARTASAGQALWCAQHQERHGRRHTFHQVDLVSSETNLPLLVR